MPPPSRDSAVADPARRGSRYFSCASSTCHLPSRVRARRAKMSRISCVRSMTFRSSRSSSWRSCAGCQFVVEDRRRRRRPRRRPQRATRTLPDADEGRGVRPRPLLQHAHHHDAPAAWPVRPVLERVIPRRCGGVTRPTSAARSTSRNPRMAPSKADLGKLRVGRSWPTEARKRHGRGCRCPARREACTKTRRGGRGDGASTRKATTPEERILAPMERRVRRRGCCR